MPGIAGIISKANSLSFERDMDFDGRLHDARVVLFLGELCQ